MSSDPLHKRWFLAEARTGDDRVELAYEAALAFVLGLKSRGERCPCLPLIIGFIECLYLRKILQGGSNGLKVGQFHRNHGDIYQYGFYFFIFYSTGIFPMYLIL